MSGYRYRYSLAGQRWERHPWFNDGRWWSPRGYEAFRVVEKGTPYRIVLNRIDGNVYLGRYETLQQAFDYADRDYARRVD